MAFLLGRRLDKVAWLITVFDAAGLSLFAVTGATRALASGLGAGQAVILGAVTGVGGGTLRDVLLRQVPTVLRSELYAIPALSGRPWPSRPPRGMSTARRLPSALRLVASRCEWSAYDSG